MRKNQIKKLNLSLVFSVLFFVLCMGIAYSIYVERYVGNNNYFLMGDLYVRNVGSVEKNYEGLFPEEYDNAVNSIKHPYIEYTFGDDTVYLRDNEIGLLIEGANDSNEDIVVDFLVRNGEDIEGKQRYETSGLYFAYRLEDLYNNKLVKGYDTNNLSNYLSSTVSSITISPGQKVKYLFAAAIYLSENSVAVSSTGTSSGSSIPYSYDAEDFSNRYYSIKLIAESNSSVTTRKNPNVNNMGIYRLSNKNSISSINVIPTDESTLLGFIEGKESLGIDNNIDLNDISNAYIDLSYKNIYSLTNDYSNASDCDTLGSDFCSGKGFYKDSYVKIGDMFNEYGLYLTRDELDELENANIIVRKGTTSTELAVGLVENGTLNIYFTGEKIVLPKDSQYFFSGFSNVSSINFTNVDFSNCASLVGMFKDDISLNNVDLREAVKSKWYSLNSMFYNCTSLVNYGFSKYMNDSLEYTTTYTTGDLQICYPRDAAYMFYHCTSLTTHTSNNRLLIDNLYFETNYLYNASHMFEGCTGIVNIKVDDLLDDINTDSALDYSYMFKDCTNLVSFSFLYSSNFKANNFSSYKGMFYNCTSLITLPFLFYDYSSSNPAYINPITKEITYSADFSYIFYNCTSATGISIYTSTFNTNGIADLSYAFANCTSLTSFNTKFIVKANNLQNVSHMYYNCSNLTNVNVDFLVQSPILENMESMFEGCSDLTTLTSTSGGSNNYFTINKKVNNVNNLFKNCTSLLSLMFMNSTINISPNSFNTIFTGCTGLVNLGFGSDFFGENFGTGLDSNGNSLFDKLSVNSINVAMNNNCFPECSQLLWFQNDNKIKTLDFIDAFFSPDINLKAMFKGMTKMTNLNFSLWTMEDNVATNESLDLESICENCTSLETVCVGLTYAPYAMNIGSLKKAFSGCSALNTFMFDFVSINSANLENLFYNDSNLEHIYLGANYPRESSFWNTFANTYNNTFYGCTSLTGYSSSKTSSSYGVLTTNGGYLEVYS